MQFKVMPFGLHSAPATFQRLLDRVLGPELEPHVFGYLDDIIVISPSFKAHLRHLVEVFRRLRHAGLRINSEKCNFAVPELRYLGHVVSREGIPTDPAKITAITPHLTSPRTVREVRRFLGTLSWYRRFVPNFSSLARPLTGLTKKNKRWRWTEEEQLAFEALKKALIIAPILACPDFTWTFCLQTDASDTELRAVLTQEQHGTERVIAYASWTLSDTERKYSATEECLAVV